MPELLVVGKETFHVERQFSEGENSQTYLLKNGTVCKVIDVDFFQFEIETLQRVNGYDHMVKYIKSTTIGNKSYIFMEYAGPSLSDVNPDSATRVDIMTQLIDAIKTLISLNLFAEDISPQNMCYDEAGHLTLIDFGECAAFDDSEVAAITTQYFKSILYNTWVELGGDATFANSIRAWGNIKRNDVPVFTKLDALSRLDAMRAALRPSEVAAPAMPKRVKTGTIRFWP